MAILARGQKWRIEDVPGFDRKRRAIITLHDQHFLDEFESWQEVREEFGISDLQDFWQVARNLRHGVYIGENGERRWYPRRNQLDEYISFGRLQYHDGSTWQNVPITDRTIDGNHITWSHSLFAIHAWVAWNRLKFAIVLKSSLAAKPLRWDVGLNNLTRDGMNLVGQDGETVGQITPVIAWDANGDEENPNINIDVSIDGGYIYFTGNQTEFANAIYPIIIDPTLSTGTDKDTYISSGNATTNYGSSTSLYLGKDGSASVRTLLEPDCSGIDSDATCDSATLTMYSAYQDFYPSYERDVSAYELRSGRSGWTEAGATWNKYDGTNDWSTAGVGDTSNDRLATACGSGTTPDSSTGFFDIDFTAADVEDWFGSTNENYGIVLIGDESSSSWKTQCRSSEYTTEAQRPVFEIVYTEAVSGVEGTLSATLGALTLSATGEVAIEGTLSQTLGALALSATGELAINGALSATLGALTLTATGDNGYEPAVDPTAQGTIGLVVKVGGVDITAYVPRMPNDDRGLPGITISQAMGKPVDTATFAIEDGAALTVQAWDEVLITNAAETVRYFAGFVTDYEYLPLGPEIDLICNCQDYTILAEKSLINYEWEDETVAQILSDIRTLSEPPLTEIDFSTYATSTDGTITRLRFSRKTVRDALDELAKRAGAEWYIDYNKNLHWFVSEENTSPHGLSDDPDHSTTYPYGNLLQHVDGMDVINRVTVVGGRYLSEDVAHIYPGDGEQTLFVVPHSYHAQEEESAVIIETNTGTDVSPVWTAKTLGIKYIDDDESKDVLYAFQERYFEFATAPPNLVKSWRVSARYEVPLRVRVRSDDSYDRYGRWFERVIIDDKITDKESARQAGKAALAENALARTVYSLNTGEPTLRAGEIISLTNSLLGIDDDYLIRLLEISFPGPTHFNYYLELGDYIPDLYAVMLDVARKAAGEAEWREDEVLDELLVQEETLSLTEGTPAVDTSAPPYTWGDGGANDFNWSFGAWS